MAIFMRSENLVFRAPEERDVPKLQAWINEPSMRHFFDHRVVPIADEAERAWIRALAAQSMPRPEVVFVFGPSPEAEAQIGCTGLHRIHWVARSAEWGIMIDPAHQGRGYGREVAARILAYAFTDLNLNRVELRVTASNARGLRCYEASGFVREGVLRESNWSRGRLEDTVVMSVLRAEWSARQTG